MTYIFSNVLDAKNSNVFKSLWDFTRGFKTIIVGKCLACFKFHSLSTQWLDMHAVQMTQQLKHPLLHHYLTSVQFLSHESGRAIPLLCSLCEANADPVLQSLQKKNKRQMARCKKITALLRLRNFQEELKLFSKDVVILVKL